MDGDWRRRGIKIFKEITMETKYKVYIEQEFMFDSFKIYMMRHLENNRAEYVTMLDGSPVINQSEEGELLADAYFIKMPRTVFESLLKGMINYLEMQGGAPTKQSLLGEVKRLDDEVKWFRETVGSLLFKS